MTLISRLILLFAAGASAQTPPPDVSRLTVERVYGTEEFKGDRAASVKWLEGGGYTTLLPSKVHKNAHDIVRFDAAGKSEVLAAAEKLVPPAAKEPLAIQGYEPSKNLDVVLVFTNSSRVWRQNTRGDWWTLRRSTGKLVKLGGDAKPSTLMFAKLSPDGERVGYVRDGNLYVEPVDGGPAVRLTADGSTEVINGTFDWVYEEEFDCRDGWRWSPDGKTIAYWQLDTRGVKAFTLVDNVAGSYPIFKTFTYPKAGERNSLCRVGTVAATGGPTKWIEVPGDTRTDCYIPRMEWAGNSVAQPPSAVSSRELVIQCVNRRQNAIEVLLADAATGKVRKVLTERDGAWVDLHDDAMTWVEGGEWFTWLSERDGWRHLYLVSRDGSIVKRVTGGEFDVIHVLHVDEKADRVWFVASPDEPTRQYLYCAPLSGCCPPQRVSDQPGWHDYSISRNGALAVHSYSAFGKPPRTEIVSLPDHKVVRTIAANDKLREVVAKLAQPPVEFFRVDIGGGVMLDGWMLKPPGMDPAKKHPLVFHVYGEPAGQSVKDRWGGSLYLWHLMLAQRGYVVACVDNRGTPCPRGRDWRKAAHRRVGTLASEDQSAAARELLKRPYLDPARVGVWGWSGGGSTTLNLLFRHGDLYRTGIAVASVPDMRLYDTIYQERYMGLPQDNGEDYKNGSPITHAAGLKGNLLLIHGSGDDNCHCQGMEKLVDRLVELNKPFDQMVYPNRSHSINEGRNTSRHLFELMTRYLDNHLPVRAP